MPPSLKGLDLEAYNAVQNVCEKLLTTGAVPFKEVAKGVGTNPLKADKLVELLRQLARSVERHTKRDGRTGYLEFISKFIPQ